jgi:hypothetical protein
MVGHVGNSQSNESFGAMTLDELAELLFCSSLQPSQYVDSAVVCTALAESLDAHHGRISECVEELAACYGKDPEVTCHRMRWARTVIAQAYGRRVVAG